jgi:hypothetical protein
MTARTRQLGQCIRDRIARTGQSENDSKQMTMGWTRVLGHDRTGKLGLDNPSRTAITVHLERHPGQDNRDNSVWTGQADRSVWTEWRGYDRQDRTNMAGQPE